MRHSLTCLLALAAVIPTSVPAEEPPVNKAVICIQPLAPTPNEMLGPVARGIRYIYGTQVEVLPERPLPKSAWYAPRKRYRADTILTWMRKELLPKHTQCGWIVGLTKHDVSVTKGEHKDWGVLGLGEVNGQVAVVSSHRTHKKLRKPHTALRRTVKVVNHEIGHMMGLPHVKGEGCLMNDAEGSVLTTDLETGLLCEPTIQHIETHKGLKIPRHEAMDWTQVESPTSASTATP